MNTTTDRQSWETLYGEDADEMYGTALRGYVTTTRRVLEARFGKPTFFSPDLHEKVTTEWVLRFADGSIATVYDWKRYEEGAPEMDETVEWHIGGKMDALENIAPTVCDIVHSDNV